VQDDLVSGIRSGVKGTPCFFINGVRHDRAWDLATLLTALQEEAAVIRHA
jgi:protein-disulfide isomerase